ncbi:putative disease resistance protein RGA3 [Vigna radiata var. radiata]|uniref:Disease resistance protein RGA3 n=1 Tax=Vigna radiata var. radiata TaxID=3916 RepID=A0A3Q0FBX9_VIGRR|nr:putative disease resistance protein RGA3 [Vigna radiata var. radiata]
MIQLQTPLPIAFLFLPLLKLMAESLLFSSAESLLGKLASRAFQEASLAFGVHRDLQQMKETMELIRGVLLDAEKKNPQSSALSEWLIQIKRVFSDAEDIVDDFECETLRKHVVNTYGSCSRKVSRFFSSSNPVVYRLRMAHHIQDINTRLTKLASQRSMFDLQVIHKDTRVVHVREMTHSHVNPSNVTGREHDKQEIIKLLLQDDHGQSLSVISIVGMGGLGKTTLAKLVFNDPIIHACFPLRMWVCVSNEFELRNVLIKILNSTPNPTRENFNNFETEQLQIHLRNTLQGQKSLLVLDNVWNEDPTRWDELREIIDVGVEGSKILVTTRSHKVATIMHIKSSNLYLLGCLSEEDSLSLFVKYAFKDGDEMKHPQLLKIGEEIVKKCGGLPLAVKTVGSSLFSKVDEKEWKSVRDNEIWNLEQNEKDILPALKLSYDQLPSYLKPCFASFSLYTKDTSVFGTQVCTLWGALGFLPTPKASESMMDVATQLLHELWSRSFLSEYEDYGGECRFKLHDLVIDLAVYIAKGEFEIIDNHNPKLYKNAHHLRFVENNLLDQALLPSSLRTIIFPRGANNEDFLNTLVSRCKFLRVLNLNFSEYASLPRCIGKLKHLRSLSLMENENLTELPDSICKLQNLETLLLVWCMKLQKLPKGLANLVSLRYLGITTIEPACPEKDIASLTSLEKLGFYRCDNFESLFKEILLPTLKEFSLSDCKSLKTVSFHAIKNLEVLMISNCNKLELSMGLNNQILDLRLKLLILSDLPRLVTLPRWLQGSANSLQSLYIQHCINIYELPDWLPTLNCLQGLSFLYCPNLLSLPDNMHRLTNLKEINVTGSYELWKRYKPDVGQDWHKISHVNLVCNDYQSESEEELTDKS